MKTEIKRQLADGNRGMPQSLRSQTVEAASCRLDAFSKRRDAASKTTLSLPVFWPIIMIRVE